VVCLKKIFLNCQKYRYSQIELYCENETETLFVSLLPPVYWYVPGMQFRTVPDGGTRSYA